MRKLPVVLVVLGLALVGADRLAHALATDEAEQRLATEGLTEPSVSVGGFPFLTQLLARDFAEVEVDARSLVRDAGRARDVTATARDVHVQRGREVTVGELSARGVVPYDEVLRRVDLPGLRVGPTADGQVRLRRDVTVLGQSLTVTATARVEARGNRLRVVPTAFELVDGAAVDDQLASLLVDRFAFSYALRDLPDGVTVRRIVPTDEGFAVEVSGRDVSFSDVSG